MSKEDKIEVEWKIIKALPSLVFEVQLPDDFWWGIVQGYLSGKMRNNYIKLIEGDLVTIELSPYDLSKGRITFRGSKQAFQEAAAARENNRSGKGKKG